MCFSASWWELDETINTSSMWLLHSGQRRHKNTSYMCLHLVPSLFCIEVVTIPFFFFFLPTRFPLGHVALWEPAGSGPGHLQPCPQQELQAAGLDGATQQRDQTHQQLHASGMTPGGVGEQRGSYMACWDVRSIIARFIDVRLSWQFVCVRCVCVCPLYLYKLLCAPRVIWDCVWML